MLWRLVFDFWWANRRGRHAGALGSGSKNPGKKLAHVWFRLGHMLSQNHAPEISDPGPPLIQFRCFSEITRPGHFT